MKSLLRCLLLSVALFLAACQTSPEPAAQPSYPANPTDSGSSYSNFRVPSSRFAEQDTDLED